MLKRCEDTNLSLNWENSHFMVKEGIVLGHKISKSGLEVDRAKVEVIAKLPHPTSVKGVRSFLGHAGFYRRFIQDFSKIARPMTHLLEKEWIYRKSQENSQKRASTDTRIRRVQKEAKESKPKPEKSNPQSSPVTVATSTMVKAQEVWVIMLNSLTELAQHVTSKNDKLAIIWCPQFDQTAIIEAQMIEEMIGLD
ncbi:hypothetical protein Tco_1472965 [Tanacetum coccineum]